MNYSSQIKIGKEFFEKIKLDYANWRYALVREFLQNCFDAPGCKEVRFDIHPAESWNGQQWTTKIIVSNNGQPMSRDILTSKLLTLGGSGKNFEGENTGGFGVAKSLLYYCHESYLIRTGNLMVEGCGSQYTISQASVPFNGTCSEIILSGDEQWSILDSVKLFAKYSTWRGKLIVNGEELPCEFLRGRKRRDFGWCQVYANSDATNGNRYRVRINGQPMFSGYTPYKGLITVELIGKASEYLTSNRDALTGKYRDELGQFLSQLGIDKRSALREQKAAYKKYTGEVQNAEKKAELAKPKEHELGSMFDLQGLKAIIVGEIRINNEIVASSGSLEIISQESISAISVGPQFITKNLTGKDISPFFTPGPCFTQSSKALVKAWTGVLLKLYSLCGKRGEFSVGFIFDDEIEAEAEQSKNYGLVYYINPVSMSKNSAVKSSISTPRYPLVAASYANIISLAAHEFVHGAYGLGPHDEDYANRLTEVMIIVLNNISALSELCMPGDDAMEF